MNIENQLPFTTQGDAFANAGDAQKNISKVEPKTNYIYVLPYNYTHHDVQLTFTIELYKGSVHNKESLVMSRQMTGTWSPNWEIGKYYTYNVRLTGTAANLQPIVFQTATDMNLGWTTGSNTATDMSFSTN